MHVINFHESVEIFSCHEIASTQGAGRFLFFACNQGKKIPTHWVNPLNLNRQSHFYFPYSYRVPLLKTMVEKGWCQLLPTLLHTTENDTREKVLQALHVMVTGCKSEFKKAHVQDSLNKLKLEWLKDANAPDVRDNSEYAGILAQLVTDLMSKLT